MILQTEDTILERALMKLEDHSDDIRMVLTYLIKSGFKDVDELVELGGIAKESILPVQQEWRAASGNACCGGA